MFELFGSDTMNTMMNSQSLYILFAIVILLGISFKAIY